VKGGCGQGPIEGLNVLGGREPLLHEREEFGGRQAGVTDDQPPDLLIGAILAFRTEPPGRSTEPLMVNFLEDLNRFCRKLAFYLSLAADPHWLGTAESTA
jgi:hypothetical protein